MAIERIDSSVWRTRPIVVTRSSRGSVISTARSSEYLMALSDCPMLSCSSCAIRLRSASCAVISCAESIESSSREALSSRVRASMRTSSCPFISCRSACMSCSVVMSERTITARSAVRLPPSCPPLGIRRSVTLSTRSTIASRSSKLLVPLASIVTHELSRRRASSQSNALQTGCNSECTFSPCSARTRPSPQVSMARLARTMLRPPSSTQTTSASASTVHSHSCFARAMAERSAGLCCSF